MTVELWPVARFSSGPRIRHARVDAVVMRSREPMLSGDGSSHLLLKGYKMKYKWKTEWPTEGLKNIKHR